MDVVYWKISTTQECIPVGCVPSAHWPYLVVSAMHSPRHICPLPCMSLACMPPHHACLNLPCTLTHHPPCTHTPTTHTPLATHSPCHAHPLPHMPPAMHASHGQNSWHTLLKYYMCSLAPTSLRVVTRMWLIAGNNQKTCVNIAALANGFKTLSVKCWADNFSDLASEGPDTIMHQLKSISNSPFKDSHSHPVHTCVPVIARND